MPLHDWSRIPHNVFHAFDLGWIWNLAGELNEGLLPDGFVARPEEVMGPFETDVLALEQGSGASEDAAVAPSAGWEPTLTIAPPRLAARRERRVSVWSAREERRVALIEVVSPGNKDSELRARAFRDKLVDCVGSGLHAVLIDVLPPTGVARGFGAAVAQALGASRPLADGARESVSFEYQDEPLAVRVYRCELVPGQPLPATPLFLDAGRPVQLPLESSYLATVRRLPASDREALGA